MWSNLGYVKHYLFHSVVALFCIPLSVPFRILCHKKFYISDNLENIGQDFVHRLTLLGAVNCYTLKA